jgi:hypothetical protein
MQRAREYAVRLFLHWLNERYRRAFAPNAQEDGLWQANDGDEKPVAIAVIDLFESGEAWQQRADELAARLDDTRPGSYLLWVPPGGELPRDEPDESEWVRRVVLTASKLASGRAGEVRLPVRLALGKVRDEGGYASVTGGLGRHWTEIAHRLSGSYYLDSRALKRFTRDEDEREQLYDHIALLSQALATGDITEFEHEDAWSLQRLPRGAAAAGLEDGWSISGCPEGFDPNDGGAVRRLLRRGLAAKTPLLSGRRDAVRALVLLGAYDYMSGENAGPSLRGFDPALTAPFDVICLVADAEVKPLRVARGLPFDSASTSPAPAP